jgi:hypothetical protein
MAFLDLILFIFFLEIEFFIIGLFYLFTFFW